MFNKDMNVMDSHDTLTFIHNRAPSLSWYLSDEMIFPLHS